MLASALDTLNSFHCCGYVYDDEIDFYYLRSRYYNANRGRFINADSVFDGTNLFSYCGNNANNFNDHNGTRPELAFALSHPFIAYDIGPYIEGRRCKNITTTSVRFASNLGLNNPKMMAGEGTQVNAIRHVLWTATIKSKYGLEIAKAAVESHEEPLSLRFYNMNIKNNSESKLVRTMFLDRHFADSMCDLLNNDIALSMNVEGMNAKQICGNILDIYNSSGLWTLQYDCNHGMYRLNKEVLGRKQYNVAMQKLSLMDEYGFVD